MFYVTSDNNVKLAVYDLNPGCKETVVLIHGWPLSHEIFEYQLELLLQCGYRVVSLDLRGFGNSDAPACGYTYDQMAADVYNVVRTLNLTCFTLIGFSMGGAIAVRYMCRYRGYGVKKLALLGAAAPRFTQCENFPQGVTRESVDQLIRQAMNDRAQLSADFANNMLLAGCHSDAIKNWLYQISLGASSVGTIRCAYSLRDEELRCDVTKIAVPTGIFHGKKDQVVPFELALVQEQMIPNAVLYPFENSGHGVFFDELEEFNRCLIGFLSE